MLAGRSVRSAHAQTERVWCRQGQTGRDVARTRSRVVPSPAHTVQHRWPAAGTVNSATTVASSSLQSVLQCRPSTVRRTSLRAAGRCFAGSRVLPPSAPILRVSCRPIRAGKASRASLLFSNVNDLAKRDVLRCARNRWLYATCHQDRRCLRSKLLRVIQHQIYLVTRRVLESAAVNFVAESTSSTTSLVVINFPCLLYRKFLELNLRLNFYAENGIQATVSNFNDDRGAQTTVRVLSLGIVLHRTCQQDETTVKWLHWWPRKLFVFGITDRRLSIVKWGKGRGFPLAPGKRAFQA